MNVTVLSSLLLHQKLFWVCFTGMALTMVSCLLESVVEWCFAILWTSVVVYAKGNLFFFFLYIYYRHGDVQPAMWHRTWGSGGTQHGSCGLWKFCPGVTVLVDRALKKQKTKKLKNWVLGKFKVDLPQTEKWRGKKSTRVWNFLNFEFCHTTSQWICDWLLRMTTAVASYLCC